MAYRLWVFSYHSLLFGLMCINNQVLDSLGKLNLELPTNLIYIVNC